MISSIIYLLVTLFIIIYLSIDQNNRDICVHEKDNERRSDQNNRLIYVHEKEGVYNCIGSARDFTNKKKSQKCDIDNTSSQINQHDVFFETQDHLYNYAGKINELKTPNQQHNRNSQDYYYILTSHQKYNSMNDLITYYVLYPQINKN